MKPNSSPLPPGFKAVAKKDSVAIRRKLGYSLTQACPARLVAKLYGVRVFPVFALNNLLLSGALGEFPDLDRRVAQLTSLVTDTERPFSAMAIGMCGDKIIVYNPNASAARQESDIMHEMGHHICQHPGNCLGAAMDFALRSHDERCEAEAEWLGWSLQIPEDGLMQLVRAGHSNEAIAEIYGASLQLVKFRRSVLAIDRRIAASINRAYNR